MASLRKRYQDRVESPDKSAPTAATPQLAAEPPPVAEDKPPTEPLKVDEPGPVEDASKKALKQRLAEMQAAQKMVQQATQQQPQQATEPQAPRLEQAIAHLPERIKRWYVAHPQFLTDPEKAAQVQYCHWVARRETGEEFTDSYCDRMEHLLGLKREPSSNGQTRTEPLPSPVPREASVPRASAPPPVRRQASAPVSAPPTRDVPSMTSGRPASEPTRLTREQQELARSLGLSDEEYRAGLVRMNREKQAGFHQDGGR